MKKSASLCFTKDGIANPNSLEYLEQNPEITTLALFGDGSLEAFDHIEAFNDHALMAPGRFERVGIAHTPLFEMRIAKPDGELSKPHYLYDHPSKDKWLCAKVVAPRLHIAVSDIASQSGTQADLSASEVEAVCHRSLTMWSLLQNVEERLCFPAAAIDSLMRWTYSLTPKTIDIEKLREDAGLPTLDYNTSTDILSITILDELFCVKLSLLNEIYGKFILPFFNRHNGRRLRFMVSVAHNGVPLSEPTNMSYGQIGKTVVDMRSWVKETTIDQTNPLNAKDLIEFASKVKINDDSCVWLGEGQTLKDLVEIQKQRMPNVDADDLSGQGDTSPSDGEAV